MPTSTSHPVPATRWKIEPLWLGLIGGLISSVGYTAANICLRSATEVDPVWVSCVKAFPMTAMMLPVLLWQGSKGRQVFPGPRALWFLVVASLLGQVAGNVAFQWGLGVIGIALSVPLTLGTLIVAGAAMGWIFLREVVTLRSTASIVVLIVAMTVLSLGAKDASASIAGLQEINSLKIAAGVMAACLAGASYAVLGVAIRYGAADRTPVSTTLFVVGIVGLVVLGAMSYERIGVTGMLATAGDDFTYMMLAGVFNMIAFYALTVSLKSISIVLVNALNATQAAMAALAGVLLFEEPLSGALGIGVSLTAVGLLIMKRRRTPGTEEGLPITSGQPEDAEA